MSGWSLPKLLAGLHHEIERRLSTARQSFAHPGTKGSASEHVWLELLQTYLPERYQAQTAFVVDSKGSFSDQIDIVIFDRQYSPFIFKYEGQLIIPAESVYAVFEAKQAIDATQVQYAQAKVASVRRIFSYQSSDTACRRSLSSEAATPLDRGLAHIRERVESGVR